MAFDVLSFITGTASSSPVLQEKTVIPTKDGLSVVPDSGYNGLSSVNVAGDENLVSENIVSGKSIFGVAGTASGGGGAEEVETSVDLDFSTGDMEVTPNEGEAFSKVTIPQPETLVAENIASGIEIAGIVGSFSGGDPNNYHIKDGSFEALTAIQTVEWELGRIPDILIVQLDAVPGDYNVFLGIAYRQAMLDALGGGYLCEINFSGENAGFTMASNVGMESASPPNSTYGMIRAVSGEGFTIGGETAGLMVGKRYSYKAIWGLV